MISQGCYELGSKSSIIREIFSFGLKRKAEVGEDKVYDFSLGNPSIPRRFWSFWRSRRRISTLIPLRRAIRGCAR